MNRLRYSVSVVCILFCSHANAAFTYDSRPISPDCLTALVDLYDVDQPKVQLSKCSSRENSRRTYVLDNIVSTEDKSEVEPTPYANYTVIGEDGDKFLIGLGQWTGGSGFFSNIMWVQIKGDDLQELKVVASGDRCNGGVYKFAPWQYTVNMTSADLVEFARNKSIKIQPYTDLDASAAGCVAKAYYVFHPDDGSSRLMYVKLDNNVVLSGEWEKQFVTQGCLNKVMSGYVAKKETELNLDGVKQLAAQYKQQCLQNPSDLS